VLISSLKQHNKSLIK